MNPRTENDQYFGRRFRLGDKRDFDRVFRDASSSADRYFTVLFRPNALGYARLGLAIAKRSIRRAAARNRVRRLIRESFRRSKSRLSGLDIVIMARPAADGTPNAALFDSLEKHWQRLERKTARRWTT